MRWRFGGDLGTNSCGWTAVEIDELNRPLRILVAGSRIFSDGRDPKSGASLAVDRRAARAMRRRRDRFKQRQAALLKYLAEAGLFPSEPAEREKLAALDPYALRAKALDEALPIHHVGRALFHLNQRRGFKSNRKAERSRDDGEDGKIKLGVNELHAKMEEAGAETLGAYLHGLRAASTDPNEIAWVRTRLRPDAEGYDFYPDRQMLEDEFDLIWTRQAPHHPDILTPENKERFFEIIFYQRPLKQPEIGKCTLLGNEDRLPKCHPLFQQRRLYEEINALKIVLTGQNPERLTREQRDALYLKLKDKRSVTFESLRKVLKLDPEVRFNKEGENRRDLKGDEAAAELGAKTRFGNKWAHLDADAQWAVVSRIRDQESEADEAGLIAWLQETHRLSPEQALATARARLPEGFGRFGETATRKLIEALREKAIDGRVVVYSEAVELAGLGHHSDFRTGQFWTNKKGQIELPYYGEVLERHIMPGSGDPEAKTAEERIGRLTNPTVHIALNQLRGVINELIKRYGPPEQIALELGRELKLSDEKKREINVKNRENRVAAEKRSVKLRDIGQDDRGGNRALLKLWEELNPENVLDRRCVYTGRQISIDMLFNGECEVDHILPFAATLDDSQGNRILCLRSANRIKRRRSPHEAFGNSDDWEAIAARAARLPKDKRWRFEPDAMHRFDKEGGFIARQLVDTQYLSRLAREYVSALYPETGEGSGRVWVSPGRMTEMLRRNWGLNSILPDHNFSGGADQPKNRKDHRHHAIDAIVVAVTDRGLLNRFAREAGLQGHEAANRIAAELPEPWEGFHDEVRRVVNGIVVSHKPDHGTAGRKGSTAGRLHNDTAYGLTGEKDAKGNDLVVHRVPLEALKKPDQLQGIRDPDLKAALVEFTRGTEGKAFEAKVLAFPKLGPLHFRNIRRLRMIEPLSVIPIRDAQGRAYKGYKGDSNYRYDVWELKDGKWVAEVVSMFDAHQPGWESEIRRANPTARKVLKLHQNDLLAIEAEGQDRRIVRVVKFGQNGQITLAEPHEAGELKKRDATPNDVDPFKYVAPTAGGLKRIKARQVRVDRTGRVFDPGPRDRPAQAAE